jgi:hypothetical protein
LFHEERNIIIVDILVVHGRCHGDKLPQISGLKKMSVIQVLPPLPLCFRSFNTAAAGVPRVARH